MIATAAEIVTTECAQADLARAGTSLRDQFGFADDLARRAADPTLIFRRHLRDGRASIGVAGASDPATCATLVVEVRRCRSRLR